MASSRRLAMLALPLLAAAEPVRSGFFWHATTLELPGALLDRYSPACDIRSPDFRFDNRSELGFGFRLFSWVSVLIVVQQLLQYVVSYLLPATFALSPFGEWRAQKSEVVERIDREVFKQARLRPWELAFHGSLDAAAKVEALSAARQEVDKMDVESNRLLEWALDHGIGEVSARQCQLAIRRALPEGPADYAVSVVLQVFSDPKDFARLPAYLADVDPRIPGFKKDKAITYLRARMKQPKRALNGRLTLPWSGRVQNLLFVSNFLQLLHATVSVFVIGPPSFLTLCTPKWWSFTLRPELYLLIVVFVCRALLCQRQLDFLTGNGVMEFPKKGPLGWIGALPLWSFGVIICPVLVPYVPALLLAMVPAAAALAALRLLHEQQPPGSRAEPLLDAERQQELGSASMRRLASAAIRDLPQELADGLAHRQVQAFVASVAAATVAWMALVAVVAEHHLNASTAVCTYARLGLLSRAPDTLSGFVLVSLVFSGAMVAAMALLAGTGLLDSVIPSSLYLDLLLWHSSQAEAREQGRPCEEIYRDLSQRASGSCSTLAAEAGEQRRKLVAHLQGRVVDFEHVSEECRNDRDLILEIAAHDASIIHHMRDDPKLWDEATERWGVAAGPEFAPAVEEARRAFRGLKRYEKNQVLQHVQTIRTSLQNTERRSALEKLGQWQAAVAPVAAVGLAVVAQHDEDPEARFLAVSALGCVGRAAAHVATAALQHASSHENEKLQRTAQKVLNEWGIAPEMPAQSELSPLRQDMAITCQFDVMDSYKEAVNLATAEEKKAAVGKLGGPKGQELSGEVLDDVQAPSSLKGRLPATEPCYVVMHVTEGRLLFLSWLPEDSDIKLGRWCATWKRSVLEVTKDLVGADVAWEVKQVTEDAELDELLDDILDSLNSPAAAASEESSPASSQAAGNLSAFSMAVADAARGRRQMREGDELQIEPRESQAPKQPEFVQKARERTWKPTNYLDGVQGDPEGKAGTEPLAAQPQGVGEVEPAKGSGSGTKFHPPAGVLVLPGMAGPAKPPLGVRGNHEGEEPEPAEGSGRGRRLKPPPGAVVLPGMGGLDRPPKGPTGRALPQGPEEGEAGNPEGAGEAEGSGSGRRSKLPPSAVAMPGMAGLGRPLRGARREEEDEAGSPEGAGEAEGPGSGRRFKPPPGAVAMPGLTGRR